MSQRKSHLDEKKLVELVVDVSKKLDTRQKGYLVRLLQISEPHITGIENVVLCDLGELRGYQVMEAFWILTLETAKAGLLQAEKETNK